MGLGSVFSGGMAGIGLGGLGGIGDVLTGKAGADASMQSAAALERYGREAIDAINQAMEPAARTVEQSIPALTGFVLDPTQQAAYLQDNPILKQLTQNIQNTVFPSIEAQRAAGGKSISGGTLSALQDALANPLLSTASNLLNQRGNQLFNLANFGQGARETGALSTADIITGIGSGQAAGITGSANARANSPLMQILGTGGGIALGSMLSDARTKENIEEIMRIDGGKLGLYRYNYIDDDDEYVGVMAQEVKEVYPDAVTEEDGVYYVDYGKLNIDWNKYGH